MKFIDMNPKGVMIEFFSPTSTGCKKLIPHYEVAAKHYRERVPFALIDASAEPALVENFKVKEFPTLIWIQGGEHFYYDGEMQAGAIINYVKARWTPSDMTPLIEEEKVSVELIDSTFDNFKNSNPTGTLIEFYAPWCGHCKNLAPEWERAAKKLKGKVPFGHIDATKETIIAARYSVQSFPQSNSSRMALAQTTAANEAPTGSWPG